MILVKFEDGERFYCSSKNIKVGDKIQNGSNSEIKIETVCH